MYDQFAKAIEQGQATQTPSSPIGDFPELRSFYQSSFQAPYFSTAGRGTVAQAGIDSANAEAGNKKRLFEIQNRLDEINRLTDPKNFQKIKKDDGGFDFADPDGKKITLNQYSKAVGQTPDEILKDSENAKDRQYLVDFENMVSIADAVERNDQKKLRTLATQLYGDQNLKDDDPTNKKAYEQLQGIIKNVDSSQLFKSFREYYPNVYTDAQPSQYAPGVSQMHGANQTPYLTNGRQQEAPPTQPSLLDQAINFANPFNPNSPVTQVGLGLPMAAYNYFKSRR